MRTFVIAGFFSVLIAGVIGSSATALAINYQWICTEFEQYSRIRDYRLSSRKCRYS